MTLSAPEVPKALGEQYCKDIWGGTCMRKVTHANRFDCGLGHAESQSKKLDSVGKLYRCGQVWGGTCRIPVTAKNNWDCGNHHSSPTGESPFLDFAQQNGFLPSLIDASQKGENLRKDIISICDDIPLETYKNRTLKSLLKKYLSGEASEEEEYALAKESLLAVMNTITSEMPYLTPIIGKFSSVISNDVPVGTLAVTDRLELLVNQDFWIDGFVQSALLYAEQKDASKLSFIQGALGYNNFYILHEITHIMRDHLKRGAEFFESLPEEKQEEYSKEKAGFYNEQRLLAADYEDNQTVSEMLDMRADAKEANYLLFQSAVWPEEPLQYGKKFEYYLENMLALKEPEYDKQQQQGQGGQGQGQQQQGQGQGQGQGGQGQQQQGQGQGQGQGGQGQGQQQQGQGQGQGQGGQGQQQQGQGQGQGQGGQGQQQQGQGQGQGQGGQGQGQQQQGQGGQGQGQGQQQQGQGQGQGGQGQQQQGQGQGGQGQQQQGQGQGQSQHSCSGHSVSGDKKQEIEDYLDKKAQETGRPRNEATSKERALRETAEKVRNYISNNVAHGRGSGASGGSLLYEWAEEMLLPRRDWRNEMGQIFSQLARKSSNNRTSWNRLNRRSDLSTPPMPGKKYVAPKVSFVFDTSGSVVGDPVRYHMQAQQVDELIHRYFKDGVSIITTDTEAGISRKVKSLRNFTFPNAGGGTDMEPGIEAAIEDKADLVMVFTDPDTYLPKELPPKLQKNKGQIKVVVIAETKKEIKNSIGSLPDWAKENGLIEIALKDY